MNSQCSCIIFDVTFDLFSALIVEMFCLIHDLHPMRAINIINERQGRAGSDPHPHTRAEKRMGATEWVQPRR